jgi:hypothetical protein
MNSNETTTWTRTKADIFWGEIAPTNHVLQIYDNDDIFIDTLAGFVGGGINAGESVIIVATNTHLKALESRLISYGISVDSLIRDDRYLPIIAEEMLQKFMVDCWPDEQLFNETVTDVLEKAKIHNRKVRVFGEMVAVLWENGHNGATLQLEHLWNKFCEMETFCLFCAYPKTGFTQDIHQSFNHICSAHSTIITGSKPQMKEVYYKTSIAPVNG